MELEDLFWPVDINHKSGIIPADLQLPITRALPHHQVINPDTLLTQVCRLDFPIF